MNNSDYIRFKCPPQLKNDFRATLGDEEDMSRVLRELMRRRVHEYQSLQDLKNSLKKK